MISNEKLFEQCYANTHQSADMLAALAAKIEGGAVITAAEFQPVIQELEKNLRDACAAATELSNRAKGMKPPKDGD